MIDLNLSGGVERLPRPFAPIHRMVNIPKNLVLSKKPENFVDRQILPCYNSY